MNMAEIDKIVTSKRIKLIGGMLFLLFVTLLNYINLPIDSKKVIFIPSGTIQKTIEKLNLSLIDRYIVTTIGQPQQGWINIGKSRLTKGDYLYKLCTSKAAMKSITLIPGETTLLFFQLLSKELNLDNKKLLDYFYSKAYAKEGVLVPETYKIPLGISEENLVIFLLNISEIKTKKISNKIFGNFNQKKWLHYVTIASIIEKEAANIDEMPLVSSVIYNRLKKRMKLQMDGTLNYGIYSHQKVTAKRIREDKSLYNTYKHFGLPATPICNVSFSAIRAAIFPAKSHYLYFMKSKKGTHKFTRYYSTHIKNIKNATKRNK